jgi:hypothetical protein
MPGFSGFRAARKGLIKSLSMLGLELEEERSCFNHSATTVGQRGWFGLNYPPCQAPHQNRGLINAVHQSNGLYNATKK